MSKKSIKDWLLSLFAQLIENDLVRRMLKNSGYLFSTTGVSAAASMLQGILTARMLGVEGFGILGTIILFISVINNLVSFRMGELVVKYVGLYTEQSDPGSAAALFKLAALIEVVASMLAFCLIFLLAPPAAKYLVKDPNTEQLFVLYGLVVLVNLITESSTGLLQIFDRFRRLAGLGILQSFFTLFLIMIAFIQNGGIQSILLAYLLGKTLGALIISISALREANRHWGMNWWRTPLTKIKAEFREIGLFAVSTNISATISLVTKDSEILWVSLLRNPTEAGYYKLALALANLVQMPVEPLPQATYPELSRQVARNHWGNIKYLLKQGSRLAGTYSVLATLFLLIFGKWIIKFLYAEEFLPAYPALAILLLGLVVANIFYWRRVALLALGRADYPAKLNSILAALKLAGTLTFVPRFGYLASAGLLASFYWMGSFFTVLKIRGLIQQKETATAAANRG